MGYESYNAYLMVNGISNQEKNVSHAKRTMKATFKDSPSYFKVTLNDLELVDSWIVDDSDVREQKRILTLDYQLSNGDIVDWQEQKWINTLTDNMSEIYFRGTLRRCSSSLLWLDSERNIKEAHFAFTRDFSPSLGIENGKIINLGKETRNIIIPANADTLAFTKGKRFIFDNRCWIISAIDTISNVGLIYLTVEESTIDPAKDNVELRIADYYPIPDTTPESPPTPPVSDIGITGAEFIRQGSTATYSVTESVTWSLMNEQETSTTNLAAIISQSETQCSVKANKNGVGIIVLRATLQDGSTVSKKIQVKTTY